jgi:hypothetical protein
MNMMTWFPRFFLCKYLLLLVFTFSSAQENSDLSITQNYFEQDINSILSDLEAKYNLHFYYKYDYVSNEKYTFIFKQSSFNEVIGKIAIRLNLDYIVIEHNIVFLNKNEVSFLTGELLNYSNHNTSYSNLIVVGDLKSGKKSDKIILTGKILNGATGDSLIGAAIQTNNTENYGISDKNGNYRMELKPGIYDFTISSMGFENNNYTLQLAGNGTFSFELFEKTQMIDEIRVYAQKADRNVSVNQMSIIHLDSKSIKQLPSILGEKDLIKSMTMMPGVKTAGEFGSGINVRGGGEDQNLFLMKGAPIFNTSHVMGLLSVINPDAVTNVTLYKGHIPAEYGERVSSTMDIQLENPDIKKLQGYGGIGIYNSRLLVESPLFNKKIVFKIGGRTSYSDYLLQRVPDYYLQNSSAKFYDLNGLVSINLKKDHITLFGYTGYDYFRYADLYLFNYGNNLASADWTHYFNDKISSSLLISYSHYGVSQENYTDSLNNFRIESGISYLGSKLKFSINSFTKNKVDIGLQATKYQISPGTQTKLNYADAIPQVMNKENGLEVSGFINDNYDITNRLSLQIGLRYTYYTYLGPGVIYSYAPDVSKSQSSIKDSTIYKNGQKIAEEKGFEPRISIKYKLSESSSVKLSYNKNRQFISLLSYSSITSPDDIWKLSDKYIKPIVSDQIALGFYQNFLENRIESSVEIYYKKLYNLIDYKNGAHISMNDHVETELVNAEGTNYGIEFLLKKNIGELEGWITYTYSRALKQTSGIDKADKINSNVIYPSQYDKPHDLSVNLNYHVNRRLRFGFNFSLSSGRSVTLPEYSYQIDRYKIVHYSDRNKYRLPAYNRLDLSVSYDESLKRKKAWKGSWTFSILNIYGRKNAYSVFYKKEQPSEANHYKEFSMYKLYLIGKPMPTLTYNFKF